MKSDQKVLTWDCVIEADSIDYKIALVVEAEYLFEAGDEDARGVHRNLKGALSTAAKGDKDHEDGVLLFCESENA